MNNTSPLSVPGRTQNNPLVTLNEHMGNITAQLSRISQQLQVSNNARIEHQYVLLHAGGSRWVTACNACSAKAGSVVSPCTEADGAPAPPGAFDTEGFDQPQA